MHVDRILAGIVKSHVRRHLRAANEQLLLRWRFDANLNIVALLNILLLMDALLV